MHWVRVSFKGKKVWAAAQPDGQLIAEGGRIPIRYSDKAGVKIYRAGVSGLAPVAGAKPQELPDGKAADDSPRKTGGTKRKGSSGFGSAGTRTAAQAAAAKAQATQDLAAIPEGTPVAFTDGACRGNPGPCGAGAVVKLADGTMVERAESLGIGTNNVGELHAVGLALDLLEEAGVDSGTRVVLHTDSKYSLGVLSQGWKAKKNTELILGLRARLESWPALEIRWVAGHVGIAENERADQLASGAAHRAG